MEPASGLTALESVCCLDCGAAYAKPSGGGTLSTNPGCPECGYVGWRHDSAWLSARWPRDRFGGDRRQRLASRSG